MDQICVQRLEKLKQAVILNHFDIIDFDKSKNFYGVLLDNVFRGNFDHCFLSVSLSGAEVEEKREIFQLARKYKSLCFYMGDVQYWMDSIGGVYTADCDFVTMKILDHYDFLLGLARDGGEDVLKLLLSFQDSFMSREGSVIDYLRNCFSNDDMLKDILIDMSQKNGSFKDLNEVQKRILCSYPEGILFHKQGKTFERISIEELVQSLEKEYFHRVISRSSSFEDLGDLLSDDSRFEEVVLTVHQTN